jgi:signal transduction histidine kinase
MSQPGRFWADQSLPDWLLAAGDSASPDAVGPRTVRDWFVDSACFLAAVTFGVLILMSARQDTIHPLTGWFLVVDVGCGTLACLCLWWRRRWPVGVALVSVLLGTFSATATIAGILALSSLAVRRSIRPVILIGAVWVPSGLLYAAYSGRTDALSVVLLVVALVAAAVAWGLFIRARRQLLLSLRERAQRAEAEQRTHADGVRLAERTRIAREMHDVLAHRISMMALHAGGLELRPDLPPEQIRQTAELLTSTARQALKELADVIGVLREAPGVDPTPAAPQPRLSDIPRLVEDTRSTGAKIEFEMRVDQPDAAPGPLGRDAYRIVQEALTNIGKHARGTAGRVTVTGATGSGLHVSIRNRMPIHADVRPVLPGSGSGLLGLQERVSLAGGTLAHGPDASGDFVVDAELPW